MKRWAFILLTASLIANVFLLGLIGGSVWHWTHDRGMSFRGAWGMRIAASLPEPNASALRTRIRETVKQTWPEIRKGRAARAEAARLFVQPRFDADAITARLNQARTVDMALRATLDHRIIAFAATLPQDQRAKMAKVLQDGPFSRGCPHGRGAPAAPSPR